MNNLGTRLLETDRLILRRFVKDDALDVFNNWASDSNTTKFLGWPAHQSVDETSKIVDIWIKGYENNSYNWNIILKSTNESIGNISVINSKQMLEQGNAYVYYCLGSNFFKKGYASEALKIVIAYLIEDVLVNEVSAGYDSLNEASGRVMEKVGMKKINVIKNMGLNPETGKYETDRIEYALTKNDYYNVQKIKK